MKKIFVLLVMVLFASSLCVAQEVFFQNGLSHDILEVKFSPDMTKLVAYSYDDGVFMWSVRDGRLLWYRDTGFVQKSNEYYTLTTFAFSPDQKLLASGSGNGTVQLWDAETGKILWRADVHKENVTALEFSPDGRSLVSAASPKGGDAEIRIVDVADGRTIKKLEGNPCTVVAMNFENDGRLLKTGNLDGNVFAWDPEAGRRVDDAAPVRCGTARTYEWETSFSSDLKMSASRTGQKELSLKNTETGSVVKKMDAEAYRLYSRFGDGGRNLIVSGYDGFTFLDLATGETRKIPEFSRTGSTIDLSRDGSLFAEGGSWGDAAVKITETATGKSFFLDGHPGIVGAVAYTPDGKFLAVGGSDKNIYIFDAVARSVVRVLKGHGKPVNALAFSPDGRVLISSGDNETMKAWDWQSGSLLRDLKSKADIFGVERISFSAGSRYFLTTSDRAEFRLWDAKTFDLLRDFKTAEKYQSSSGEMTIGYDAVPVNSAAFGRDGKTIVSAHADGTLRVWDTVSGRQLRKLKACPGVKFAVPIDGDRKVLAYCDEKDRKRIAIFDAATGRETFGFDDEDTGFIEILAISLDGRYFATSDVSGAVLLWRTSEKQPVRELDVGFSGRDAIAFSPDGKTLAVGGHNRNLFMFDVASGEKLWQLIPFYEPDPLELEFEKQKKSAQNEVAVREAARKNQTELEIPLLAKKVTAAFSHYGIAESFWDQKIAESGAPDKSKLKLPKDKANVAWFTLTNGADLPVSIDTNSMMFDPKCKGLCDGAEISLRYVMEFENGDTRVNGYDMFAKTQLPPKTTVYFSVGLDALADSKKIYFGVTFQKDNPDDKNSRDYGTEQKLYLNKSDLP